VQHIFSNPSLYIILPRSFPLKIVPHFKLYTQFLFLPYNISNQRMSLAEIENRLQWQVMLLHIWIVSGPNLGPETAQQEVTGGIPQSFQANAGTPGSSSN
jgi:hypothetical protein